MSLTFRDAPAFWRETLHVTGFGAAAGLIATFVTSLPLAVTGVAAALFGSTLGASLSRQGPGSKGARAVLGVIGGGLAAMGHVALATRFGLGFPGALLGGALGGFAVGTLLSAPAEDEDQPNGSTLSMTLSGLGGATLGLVGTAALAQVAAFATAEAAPVAVAAPVMAGLMGLWLSAGAGLRRIEQQRDPILAAGLALLEVVEGTVKVRLAEGLASYVEILDMVQTDISMSPALKEDTRTQARALTQNLVETAQRFHQADLSLSTRGLADIEEKLADLALRQQSCDDEITRNHLRRAASALKAQQGALRGLKRNLQRCEAAVDAQVAVLDRLKLAVAQAQATTREVYAVELSEVADQAARLSEDLDSLSEALSNTDHLSDRRLLADIERIGNRSLGTMETRTKLGTEPLAGGDDVAEQSVELEEVFVR